MQPIVVLLVLALASALKSPERAMYADIDEPRTSSWILLSRTREVVIWLDTARIRQQPSDSTVDVWLRYAMSSTQSVSQFPDAARFKTLEIETAVGCKKQAVRASAVIFYDSTGALMGKVPIPATGEAQSSTAATVRSVLPLLCSWLEKARPVAKSNY